MSFRSKNSGLTLCLALVCCFGAAVLRAQEQSGETVAPAQSDLPAAVPVLCRGGTEE